MDDVGEVVRFGRGESDGFRRDVGRLHEQKRRATGKVLRRAGIRDDNGWSCIRDDGREASRRIGRIERDVGGSVRRVASMATGRSRVRGRQTPPSRRDRSPVPP